MRNGTFKLTMVHPDREIAETAFSDSAVLLRVLGRDHHKAALTKPDLSLASPEGQTIATMDAWATDWVEAGQ